MSTVITATKLVIGMPRPVAYTVINAGSKTVYVLHDITQTVFAGTHAELDALKDIELLPGEYCVIEQQVKDVLAVCATGETSLLRSIAGEMKSVEFVLWDDLMINSGAFAFAGASNPTLSDWQPGGSGATFKAYKFIKGDEIFFSAQLPHTYKEGTDVCAHVHWTPGDRGSEESGAYVGWKLDYSWINVNGVFLPSSTIDMSDTCTGVDDHHEVSAGLTDLDGTGMTISSMITGRLYRSDTGADDTWAGVTAAQSPALLQIDFHHQVNSDGSLQEWVK